jgi:hypothetical protein
MRASDAKYHSPFSYAAIQAGYVYLGGKVRSSSSSSSSRLGQLGMPAE